MAAQRRVLRLFVLVVALAAIPPYLAGDDIAPSPIVLDRPLIACWSFDELFGGRCADSSGKGHDAAPERGGGLARVPGLFGVAMGFSGSHLLRVPGKPAFGRLGSLSLSAWVKPTELGVYREIFRKEDGDERVLFSFQHDGTILSLGLNVDGYVECDARVEPARLLDGRWHHCAATFDGRFMRVYLDGREVGSLERPGTIQAGGPAAGCIGSSNGGECFQGAIDELRLYGAALTPEEVTRLHENGAKAMAHLAQPLPAARLEERLNAFYAPEAGFAATLAGSRRRLLEKGIALDLGLAGVVAGKLRTAFPDECARFTTLTGANPVEFLAARTDDFQVEQARRVLDLLLEYRPLTEEQKRRQTPEDARRWREAEAVERRFERLRALGDAGRFSPEWVEILLDAGARVQLRPYVQEAVAPYVRPETPPTRALSPAEARQALERDWLHQAGGAPTPERVRDEIRWTRELAERIESEHPRRIDFRRERAHLAALEQDVAKLDTAGAARLREGEAPAEPPDARNLSRREPRPPAGIAIAGGTAAGARELYLRVREVKREIAFRNPVVDFDRVLFVDTPFPQGSEWQHETRHRLGYMAVPGGRLLVLKGLSPGGTPAQLMPQAPLHGSFWRPDVSYDGRRVLFCFKPHNEKSFHLYEMAADGTGLTQLTDGPYDDLDPIYLPDERHVLFSTTRAHTYVRCMPPTNAYVLARCDRDGRNVYLVSANNEPDYLPSVMDDGRILYTRWEYTDKPLWRAQGLWTVNPDGTQVSAFWGNQSVWPDLLKDARGIPGSRRVMFTGSAHHGWFSGSVGIITPGRGHNFPDGLTKITADTAWPEVGNGSVDPVESPRYHASGRYGGYYSPYPLSDHDFLVSANRGGRFVLYLMDVDGNRELIYEGAHHVLHAMPLRPRRRPPVIPDAVRWPTRDQRLAPEDGVFFSADVCQGLPAAVREKVCALRVLHIEPKTYTYWHKRPYISTGPVVSMVQSEGVKRLLGTVPVEADGSVSFYAPPGKALHFQLLDEGGRALQTMRSFASLMPGERRGCLGCHELHSVAPAAAGHPTALTRPPSRITPPPWGDDTVSYARYVQPVLDRYCGSCHQGEGPGRARLDLTRRPGFLHFDEPYVTLIGRPSWGRPNETPKDPLPGWGIADTLLVEGYAQTDPAAYRTPEPMTRLSYRSRLIDIASSGRHHGVRADPVSVQRLIAWVDAMCPYLGDEEIRREPDPIFQGMEWLAIRPRIATAPRIVRPGPVDE